MEEGLCWRRNLEETCEGSYGENNTNIWGENMVLHFEITIFQYYFDYDRSVVG